VVNTLETEDNTLASDKKQVADYAHDDPENDASSQAAHPSGKMVTLEMRSH